MRTEHCDVLVIGGGPGGISAASMVALQGRKVIIVNDGPLLENVGEGDDVDILKFPVPIHHEEDGGRYIGTACGVITRDPDTDRINSGTYRCMVHDGQNLGVMISNGKQGLIHRDKYFDRGEECKFVILVGEDPLRGRGLAEGPADLIAWPGSAGMA